MPPLESGQNSVVEAMVYNFCNWVRKDDAAFTLLAGILAVEAIGHHISSLTALNLPYCEKAQNGSQGETTWKLAICYKI